MRALLLSFLSAFCFTLAYTQTGTLDPDFGNAGIVKSNLFYAGGATSGRKTFVLPDGKLLVVVQEGTRTSFAQFLPDGSFDASFLNIDQFTTDVAYGDAAQDSDGRIVIAGTRNQNFALTRYDTFGNIDLELNISFPEASAATAVAIQDDGKIVVAGYTYNSGVAHFAVVRCHADGTLDSSFSGDGKQTTTNGNNGAFVTAIAIQGDDKIVVGGYAGGYGARRDFAVVRYNTNGTRDLTFSDDGKQLTTVGVYDDIATAMAIQADGKILLTGRTQSTNSPTGEPDMATVRYNTNGSLDSTFGGDGIVLTSVGTEDEATSILVQDDTKIVVTGNTKTGAQQDVVLLRYNNDGNPDAGFGNNGKQITDFNNGADWLSEALLIDDTILVTGWSDPTGGRLREIALARYTATGEPDISFSGDGKTNQYFSTGSTGYSGGIAVQKDGKLLAVGYTESNFFYEDVLRIALARYNPDGTFDESFGVGGKVATEIGGFGSSGKAFALQDDGKIVVGGHVYGFNEENSGEDFLLVRYNTDGSLDNSFGTDGMVYIDFSDEVEGSSDVLSALAIQPDGKIVAVGSVYDDFSFGYNMGIARVNTDGSLDGSFSGNGKQTIRFNETGFDQAYAVAIQADKKIVVAGSTILESTLQSAFALARLNTDGSLDSSFSRDGKLTTTFGNFGMAVHANTIAIQPDTKIVVGGRANGNFALARYFANGNLDLSFSGDGKHASEFGGDDAIRSILIQPDNKILAAGTGNNKFALARYQPNGLLDSSFGVNGRQTTDIETGLDEIGGIAVSGDRLYAAGTGRGIVSVGVVAAYQLDETTLLTKAVKAPERAALQSQLVVHAFPNPTTQFFTIQTGSGSAALLSMRVTDATGRMVDVMQNRPATGSLQFGARYKPGVYYAEIQQGTETKTIKLVKGRN
jgi:uncharacterized delta-60 repeat protein